MGTGGWCGGTIILNIALTPLHNNLKDIYGEVVPP